MPCVDGESQTPSGENLVVTLQDGEQVATLTFDDFTGILKVGSDGSGGTLITDPPAASHPSPTDGGGAFTNVGLNLADDQSTWRRPRPRRRPSADP